jgi:hypothetical protein
MPKLAMRKTSFASMAVDVADIDRDGYDDFVVMEMLSRSHQMRHVQRDNFELDPVRGGAGRGKTLESLTSSPQVKDAKHGFLEPWRQDIHRDRPIQRPQASGWSWSSVFLDVDWMGLKIS